MLLLQPTFHVYQLIVIVRRRGLGVFRWPVKLDNRQTRSSQVGDGFNVVISDRKSHVLCCANRYCRYTVLYYNTDTEMYSTK